MDILEAPRMTTEWEGIKPGRRRKKNLWTKDMTDVKTSIYLWTKDVTCGDIGNKNLGNLWEHI
jgi:hypothetical protein